MTTDELVKLLEDLLDGVVLSDIRQGHGPIGGLSDQGYVLLVRFLAGERPSGIEQPQVAERPAQGHTAPSPEDDMEGPRWQDTMGRSLGDITLL